jgi:hypothetical protein
LESLEPMVGEHAPGGLATGCPDCMNRHGTRQT